MVQAPRNAGMSIAYLAFESKYDVTKKSMKLFAGSETNINKLQPVEWEPEESDGSLASLLNHNDSGVRRSMSFNNEINSTKSCVRKLHNKKIVTNIYVRKDENKKLDDKFKKITEESYSLSKHKSSLLYDQPYDLHCKVLLLGDCGVGKTCLLMKYKEGAFLSGSYISTVGVDFRNKVIDLDNSKVKLQIWDTAGQERFRSVTHAYYRDAHALLLLYDVTNKASFDNTREWLAEVHEYAQDDVVIMLIGNKCDTVPSERQIRRQDGERLAREYNVTFMETSAKTGLNVDLAFTAVARDLKAKKSSNVLDQKFNVTEYVEKQEKKDNCTACSLI